MSVAARHALFHDVVQMLEQARASQRRRIIRARFSGRCDLCSEPIAIGDAIAWRANAAPTHARCFKGEVTK